MWPPASLVLAETQLVPAHSVERICGCRHQGWGWKCVCRGCVLGWAVLYVPVWEDPLRVCAVSVIHQSL